MGGVRTAYIDVEDTDEGSGTRLFARIQQLLRPTSSLQGLISLVS
jgi:hypothetical protein